MLATNAKIKPGIYQLPEAPVAAKVLIPGFESAVSVRGAFGWFSSGWIGRLAPGLANYINRPGMNPIKFVVAPVFFSPERRAVEQAVSMTSDEACQLVANIFCDGKANASALARHALGCLSWMIATGLLDLRIAVPAGGSNYHPKMWLFDDGTDKMLVRGSGNATDRGISGGVEHFDVDVTWSDHGQDRVQDGLAMLHDWSIGRSVGIDKIVSLPQALKECIIQTAPVRPRTPVDYRQAAEKDGYPPWSVDSLGGLIRGFTRKKERSIPRLRIPDSLVWEKGAYAHQGEAVKAWEAAPFPDRGTISMATGAGKTITALLCATRLQDRLEGRPLLVVISAPTVPLIHQWSDEVAKFGIKAMVPTLERNTSLALTSLFRRLRAGGTHVVIVTNYLIASPDFQQTVEKKICGRSTVDSLFVGDEVHTLGADKFVANKPEFLTRRLGLSATPVRQYDPDGTEEIFDFFGESVFEFGMDQAIGFCLTPYNYYVHAATMDQAEVAEYEKLTKQIGKAFASETNSPIDRDEEGVRRLLIRRRRIVETAAGKLALLRMVLETRDPRSLDGALIYASAKDPQQFTDICAILTNLGVRWAPVTQETTAKPKTLKRTLDTFSSGGYQVLLAKKVLDEGVDIPRIREAFIVASSTVEREWIQRRGRVLRRHPDKNIALVHDFLALPPAKLVAYDPKNVRKVVVSELNRAYTFAKYADNAVGEHSILDQLGAIRSAYFSSIGNSAILQRAGDMIVSSGIPRSSVW